MVISRVLQCLHHGTLQTAPHLDVVQVGSQVSQRLRHRRSDAGQDDLRPQESHRLRCLDERVRHLIFVRWYSACPSGVQEMAHIGRFTSGINNSEEPLLLPIIHLPHHPLPLVGHRRWHLACHSLVLLSGSSPTRAALRPGLQAAIAR